VGSGPAPGLTGHGTVPVVGTSAERRAARERVSAYHQSQLAELLTYVAAAIDRYRAGETGAYAVDETIHHYHRAAGELWKFCFARGGGTLVSREGVTLTSCYGSRTMVYAIDCERGGSAAGS
jgi:hypothetical protein